MTYRCYLHVYCLNIPLVFLCPSFFEANYSTFSHGNVPKLFALDSADDYPQLARELCQ